MLDFLCTIMEMEMCDRGILFQAAAQFVAGSCRCLGHDVSSRQDLVLVADAPFQFLLLCCASL